jgi:uncharacterized protein DUF1573
MTIRTWVLLLIAFAGSAFGQLAWENPEQTLNAKPEEQAVVTKYRFTNNGKEPVRIEEVKNSCDCTIAVLTKTEYAPGESGEIEVKFSFGGRTGRQVNTITVTTSAAPRKPTILRLSVNIEALVRIEPQLVFWRLAEQPDPKTIHIAIGNGASLEIVRVRSDNPAFKVKLIELKPGKEYEVPVTPSKVARPTGAILVIETDHPADNPQIQYVYARSARRSAKASGSGEYTRVLWSEGSHASGHLIVVKRAWNDPNATHA